jgi:hypothetical protein
MINYENYVVPEYEGLQFIEFREVPLKDIIRPKNGGRVSDFDIDKVKLIEHAIKNGKWFPERYEPPMVTINEKEELVLETGNNRYMGHIGAGKETMLVAVIKFDNERARIKVQNLENAQENEIYLKTYRSADDIIGSTAKMLAYDEEQGIEITEKYIKKVLKELLADKHEEYTYIFEELKKDAGIRGSVKGYTPDGAEKTAEEIHGDSNSAHMVQLYRTVGHGRADERLFYKVMKTKLELGDDAPVTVYGHFTRLGAEKVVQGRKTREANFEKDKKMLMKMYEILTSPDFTDPTFEYLPQIDGVEVNVD